MTDAPLFEVRDLHVALPDPNRKRLFGATPTIEILHGIDLTIAEGTVVGLVGESGSGKSTLGRALVRLIRPSRGTVRFAGADITAMEETALRPIRRNLQVIFQDPLSALNPRLTIGTIIARPLMLHGLAADRAQAKKLAGEALAMVGLPQAFAARYPHELSGGQRQRVGIARAIATRPRFVLADEIVSGLDVSSQAQILALLERLKRELGLTLVFISHDLSVVRRLCDRVVVLRAGRVVENRPTAELFDDPHHPYTAELKAAIPLPEVDEA